MAEGNRVVDERDVGYGVAPPSFRLPDATRIGAVHLQVADLARSIAFYTQVLGLRATAHGVGSAALTPQGSDTVLIELREHADAPPSRGNLGLYHFAILVPDRATLGTVLQHFIDVGVHPGASDHLVSEALYLSDPDGLGIEVYADRPRETWRHSARELVMATEPLDVASVLAAGRNTRWQGMPAGTVMGHVHLHVRSIGEAEGFYHEGLGFDRIVWSYPGALFLSAGGYHHHLGVNTWAGARAQPAPADAARLLEWEIVVPDADALEGAARNLAERGHEFSRDGGSVVAVDPWRTVVRLRVEERA